MTGVLASWLSCFHFRGDSAIVVVVVVQGLKTLVDELDVEGEELVDVVGDEIKNEDDVEAFAWLVIGGPRSEMC